MRTNLSQHISLIYVVGWDEAGPVKIGLTGEIIERIRNLQSANPYPLQIFYTRFAIGPPDEGRERNSMEQCLRSGALMLEKAVHSKLDEFDLRLKGEWFDISAMDAVAAIQKIGESTGVRCVGVEDLAGVDLGGRADDRMISAHKKLLHEAYALKEFTMGYNAKACGKPQDMLQE